MNTSAAFKTFSRETYLIPLDSILIDKSKRQRKAFVVDDLVPSMAKRGLLTPILVKRDDHTLVAGERRVTAALQLGWVDILCRYVEEVDPVELQIIEWEENFKRKDLTWEEQAQAIHSIHAIYCQLDPEWTAAETASSVGISQTVVSKHLRLWNEITSGNDRVTGATSAENAYNLLARKDQRANVRALEQLIGASPDTGGALPTPASPVVLDLLGQPTQVPASPAAPELQRDPKDASKTLTDVFHGSFLDWAPSYRGPKFNLIHCDFPYGANLFSGPQGGAGADIQYADTRDVFFTLLESMCDNLENFTSLSAHFLFWFSFEHYEPIKALFRNKAPSIEWVRDPLIWGKSDNAGIIRDARKHPRHTYEACLFGFRGNRNVVKATGDFYAAPTDRKLHPSAKPEPMLRNFFTMVVDEHTEMLDPTCGAGSSLRAADSLGAKRVFGIELDPEHASISQIALNNARRLRSASKVVEK